MTDDIVARLRLYAQKQRETKSSVLGLLLSDAADEIERLREELNAERHLTGKILAEIDCRVEHGADSNGHLEAILKLFSNKDF